MWSIIKTLPQNVRNNLESIQPSTFAVLTKISIDTKLVILIMRIFTSTPSKFNIMERNLQ